MRKRSLCRWTSTTTSLSMPTTLRARQQHRAWQQHRARQRQCWRSGDGRCRRGSRWGSARGTSRRWIVRRRGGHRQSFWWASTTAPKNQHSNDWRQNDVNGIAAEQKSFLPIERSYETCISIKGGTSRLLSEWESIEKEDIEVPVDIDDDDDDYPSKILFFFEKWKLVKWFSWWKLICWFFL